MSANENTPLPSLTGVVQPDLTRGLQPIAPLPITTGLQPIEPATPPPSSEGGKKE